MGAVLHSGGGCAPQAALRAISQEEVVWSEELETAVVANIQARKGIRVITWDTLRQAGISDPVHAQLLFNVGSGVESWDTSLAEYERYKLDFTVADGVVLYKNHLVVPQIL